LKGDHLRIISAKFGWDWHLNCISIMMSFLTYITSFFMNFELLPILTDYEIRKKGGWNLKKMYVYRCCNGFNCQWTRMMSKVLLYLNIELTVNYWIISLFFFIPIRLHLL
jgi:hypothetical protein